MFNLMSTKTCRLFSVKSLSTCSALRCGADVSFPPQGQDFVLLLFELHESPFSPFLHTVEVPLYGSLYALGYKPLLPVLFHQQTY